MHEDDTNSRPGEPRLLSVDQTAHALGVSARFVRLLGARQEIRIVRLGRRTLVPADEVQRLASGGRR
jgi:excisionase family DNA binding protein